jgi:hypothetical protein
VKSFIRVRRYIGYMHALCSEAPRIEPTLSGHGRRLHAAPVRRPRLQPLQYRGPVPAPGRLPNIRLTARTA